MATLKTALCNVPSYAPTTTLLTFNDASLSGLFVAVGIVMTKEWKDKNGWTFIGSDKTTLYIHDRGLKGTFMQYDAGWNWFVTPVWQLNVQFQCRDSDQYKQDYTWQLELSHRF